MPVSSPSRFPFTSAGYRLVASVVAAALVLAATWLAVDSLVSAREQEVADKADEGAALHAYAIEELFRTRHEALEHEILEDPPGELEMAARLDRLVQGVGRFAVVQWLENKTTKVLWTATDGAHPDPRQPLLAGDALDGARKWLATEATREPPPVVRWVLQPAAAARAAGGIEAVAIIPMAGGESVMAVFPLEEAVRRLSRERPALGSTMELRSGSRSLFVVEGVRAKPGPSIMRTRQLKLKMLGGGLSLQVSTARAAAEADVPPARTRETWIAGGVLAFLFAALIGWVTTEGARLEASRRDLRRVLAHHPLPALDLDAGLTVLEANDAGCGLLGSRRVDVVGQPLGKLVPEAIELLHELRRRFNPGEHIRSSALFRNRDGSPMPVEVVAAVERDDAGALRMLLSAWPADDLRRAQLLASALENVELAVLLVSVSNGKVLHGNTEAFRLLGHGPVGLVGRNVGEVLSSPTRPDAWATLQQAIHLGHTWKEEFTSRPPGGAGKFTARTAGTAIGPDGERCAAIILQAGAEQASAPAAAQESSRKYETIFNQAPHAVIVLDAKGTIVETNAHHRQHLAQALDLHVESKRHSVFTHKAFAAAGLTPFFERLFRGEELYLPEVHFPASHAGVSKVVSLKGIPVRGASGRVDGALLFMEDITERYRLQHEVWEHAIRLEEEKDRALQASRLKSHFLATISHELRTPLNAIIGFSRIVARKAANVLDEKQLQNLHHIQESGENLLHLITDLLDISKIEAGKLDLHIEETPLEPLLQDIASQMAPLLERNGDRLHCRFSPELGVVETDAQRLRQIVVNLLGNAAKFTQNGEVHLSAGASDDAPDHPGGRIVIEVADTGIGIPVEHVDKIFEEFYQVDGSSGRRYGGTGLGLAICQRLAEALGGVIQVESEPGLGSHFFVTLPRRQRRQPLVPAGSPSRVDISRV